jgi:hypothetical protein
MARSRGKEENHVGKLEAKGRGLRPSASREIEYGVTEEPTPEPELRIPTPTPTPTSSIE